MKLVEVMAAVDHVAKNGNNASQNYKFAQAADVYAAVRGELAKRFVIPIPTVLSAEFHDKPTRNGGSMTYCTAKVRYDFTDAETGEVMSAEMVGSGSDSGDKSVYKAMTGATKACLINTFLIPTGDDPENEPKQSKAPPPAGMEGLKQRATASPPRPPPPPGGVVFPNYGTAKGKPVRGASLRDLEYYKGGALRTLGDPSKANFHAKERALIEAIDLEISRQRRAAEQSAPAPYGSDGADEPPPPGDEDAPF
jgi:hypothetical protein